MLRKVAITGGLSCGKSSACRFFKELGAHVVNADEIVHQLLSPNTAIGQQVVALLGADIIVNDHLSRNIIATKVFNNPPLLRSLEKILHPAVMDEIEKQYQQVVKQGIAKLFIAEIPLLFEIHGEHLFDTTITVIADPQRCRERFQISTTHADNEYERRSAQQLPSEEKAQRADIVINNNGTLDDLRKTIKHLFKQLSQ